MRWALILLPLAACDAPSETAEFALAAPVVQPHVARAYPAADSAAVTDCLLRHADMAQLDAIAQGDTALIDRMLGGPTAQCLT